MKFRRIGSAAVAAVSVFALGACGGDDGGGGVGASLTKSNFSDEVADAQSDVKSVHLEGEVTTGGQALEMTADLEMAENVEDLGMSMSIDGGSMGTIEMVLLEGTMYMKAPGMSQDPSKPWVKLDMADPNNPMAGMLDQLLANADPSKMTEAFEAVTDLEKVGTDEVDGVDSTHYEVTVDMQKAMEATGVLDSLGPEADSMLEQMPEAVTYDVWVDSDALMTRMSMDEVMGTSVDLHFSDWGEDVTVEAPPAGEVSEFSL